MTQVILSEDELHQILMDKLNKRLDGKADVTAAITEMMTILATHMGDPDAHMSIQSYLKKLIDDFKETMTKEVEDNLTAINNKVNTDLANMRETLDTNVVKLTDIANSAVPCGTILATTLATLPEGYLWCDGSAISRVDYPKLFTAIGTTYGVGDDATTFNIPDIRDRFIEGAGGSFPLGTYVEPGLPNITGSIGNEINNRSVAASGAFAVSANYGGGESNGNYRYTAFSFNASRSSPIYGSSSTVQPNSVCLNYVIKIY